MKNVCDGKIFGSKININKSIFGGTCYALTDSEDQPEGQAEEASENGEEMTEESLDLQVAGVSSVNESTMNVSNNRRVRFADEETTIINSEVTAGTDDATRT